ncbi:hypothetical protein L1987_19135 [Smallanthus sonchifolius]|uniref:Uncharacterized protein n=1 Tax=Smallanthus sonchifolius TaxID=185202 RepID=A0ACB9J2P3_9ASTR|nr:hypothetical protein L1987_19135 [Smallanthus sonchifolius]
MGVKVALCASEESLRTIPKRRRGLLLSPLAGSEGGKVDKARQFNSFTSIRSSLRSCRELAHSAKAKEVRQVQVKLIIAFWQAISTKKHSSIGLVLHLSTDLASLADWAFNVEFQYSGTKKFLFITGRIRLSILVLEKWVIVRKDPFFLS